MKTFPEYESFDGLGLAALLKNRVISPRELLEVAIERIELRNPKINAVIYKMYDEARNAISKHIPPGLFSGVPFLLKDLLADYAGVPLSSGSHFTQNWIPKKDSELVRRIKQSGLIILGKTNTPEFGLSAVTEPVLWGPTRNPWEVSLSPGGSSGGSAAAVAARMVPMAHGNDGGGSIRIPASYCGLFGLKPSRGRTATGSNMMRLWEGMVAEHVLTRSVRDSAAMLDVLAGPELGSAISLPMPSETFLGSLNDPLPSLRIALIDEPFFAAEMSSEYAASVHQAAKICQDLGHTVESTSLQINSSEVALAYVMVVAGEFAASIKRFSQAMERKPKQNDLEKQSALISHIGEHISAADFAWASEVLDGVARQMALFFQNYDILLTPTMNKPPSIIGGLKPDLFEQGMLELLTHVPFAPLLRKAIEHAAVRHFSFYPFTPLFNITGQPAMSAPLFWDTNGLPMGIQFASSVGQEKILLQLASQLERAKPWFDKTPATVV